MHARVYPYIQVVYAKKIIFMFCKRQCVRPLAILCLLLFAPWASAQLSAQKQNYVDSLDLFIEQNLPCHDTNCLAAWLLKGEAYLEAQLFDSAEALYFDVLETFGEITYKKLSKTHLEIKSNCYNSLGALYNRTYRTAKALEYYDKSLVLSEELMNVRAIVSNLCNLIKLTTAHSKDSLEDVYIRKVMQVHPKIQDSVFVAYNWESIGEHYEERRRNLDSAIFAYTQALNIFDRHGRATLVARACRELGSIYNRRDNAKAASDHLYRALEIEEKSNNIYGIISTRLNLANVYTHQREFPKAMELLKAALDLCISHDFRNKQANILMQLGVNAHHQNMLESAQEYFELSLALVEEHQLGSAAKSLLYTQLATVNEKRGDLNAALDFALKGLELKSHAAQADIYENLQIGKLYLLLGDLQKAEKYTLNSLAICESIGAHTGIQRVCWQLSRVYKELQDYEKALRYFTRSSTIKDSLSNLEANKVLLARDTKYQIAKKEQELELAKRTSALLKEEQRNQKFMILGLFMLLLICLLAFFMLYQRKRLLALDANNKVMLQLREIEGLKSRLRNSEPEKSSESRPDASSINDLLKTRLSQRELEVLRELIKGKSNKELSEALCISVNTVTTHLKKIYTKLDVGNRTQAVEKVSKMGI